MIWVEMANLSGGSVGDRQELLDARPLVAPPALVDAILARRPGPAPAGGALVSRRDQPIPGEGGGMVSRTLGWAIILAR